MINTHFREHAAAFYKDYTNKIIVLPFSHKIGYKNWMLLGAPNNTLYISRYTINSIYLLKFFRALNINFILDLMVSDDNSRKIQPLELKKSWDLLDLFYFLNKVIDKWIYDETMQEALESFIDAWVTKKKKIQTIRIDPLPHAINHIQLFRRKFKIGARPNSANIYRFMHSAVTCNYLLETLNICKMDPLLTADEIKYLREVYGVELSASRALRRFFEIIEAFPVNYTFSQFKENPF